MLQLRAASGWRFVLLPAGSPVLFAAGYPLGLDCGGNRWIHAARCRLGPSRSRFSSPVGVGEVAAAMSAWNKSLRPCPHLDGAHSGVVEGAVREESPTLGGRFAGARSPPYAVGSCVGVRSPALQSGTALVSVGLTRRGAFGSVVVRRICWWSSSVLRRRAVQFKGHGYKGCVPGRCSQAVSIFCGSCQSLRVLLFLAVMACAISCCSALVGDARWRRCRTGLTELPEDPLDFVVIFSFSRVFCVKVGGQLSLLYGSSWFLYVYWSLYGTVEV